MAGGIVLTTTAAALKTGTIGDANQMESLRAQAAEALPASSMAPATASAPGTPGQLAYDATHIYVCIAANSWVRATLAGGF
jgi:hypothetical protein